MPQKPARYRPPTLTKRPSPSQASRPTAAQRGYGWDWQKARPSFLAEHPLCEACTAAGEVTEATVVDHRTPHKGDQKLFWDQSNWCALCESCHNRKTATENGGFGRAPKEGGS
jgi:5-methylcytosine-specific restriction protein A